MQKILSRSKFAKLAGVNPSTVTRLCGTILKSTMVGKQIDSAHPDAVKYLADRARSQTEPAATGLDILYEEAVSACNENNTYSIAFIQRELKIGYGRASKIVSVMRANDLMPDAVKRGPPDPKKPPATPAPKPRGQAAVKEAKKHQPPPDIDEIIEVPEDIQSFADMSLRDLIERFGTDARFVDWLKATQLIEVINEKRLKNAQTEGLLVSRDRVRVGVIEPIDAAHIKLLTDGAKTIARRATAMHSAERPLDDIEKFVADQITSFIRPVKTKVARALKNA